MTAQYNRFPRVGSARGGDFVLVREQDLAVANHDGDGGEPSMQARSPNTQAVMDAELGAVKAALNQGAVPVQEFIRPPVERGPGMGAGIDIGVDCVQKGSGVDDMVVDLVAN